MKWNEGQKNIRFFAKTKKILFIFYLDIYDELGPAQIPLNLVLKLLY